MEFKIKGQQKFCTGLHSILRCIEHQLTAELELLTAFPNASKDAENGD